jgi:hypothetical protein
MHAVVGRGILKGKAGGEITELERALAWRMETGLLPKLERWIDGWVAWNALNWGMEDGSHWNWARNWGGKQALGGK